MREPILVSACLIGVGCRWDGGSRECKRARVIAELGFAVPVCPEQLGGLTTPREPAEMNRDGRVLTKSGRDVTENFLRGAGQVMLLAELIGCKRAILKSKSPSCGLCTYDGSFSGKILPEHPGVTASALVERGLDVEDEDGNRLFWDGVGFTVKGEA